MFQIIAISITATAASIGAAGIPQEHRPQRSAAVSQTHSAQQPRLIPTALSIAAPQTHSAQ